MKPVTELWAKTFNISFNYIEKQTFTGYVKILIMQTCSCGKKSSHSLAYHIFISVSVLASVISLPLPEKSQSVLGFCSDPSSLSAPSP